LTSKILFFFDGDLVHFGIAKFLQNMISADFYVIHALPGNKSHYFYKNQSLVSFKKKWFLKIEKFNRKPNISYLENFEKRFNINLHKIIFLERIFFQHNYFYHFSYDEILQILESECRFFESILDEIKPDYLCIKMTDWHDGYLLSEMCRSKGIKVLMLCPARFANRWAILDDDDSYDFKTNILSDSQKTKNFTELQNYLHALSYRKTHDKLARSIEVHKFNTVVLWLKNNFLNPDISYTSHWKHRGKTRIKILKSGMNHLIQKFIRTNFLNKNTIKNIDPNEKFIYFPLHFQPERSTLIAAPYYLNQPDLITKISKSIPIGYKLLVKEHPFMSYHAWRKISYYKKILALPNVKLLHPSVSNDNIFKNCSLVMSISGSAALESCFYQKPSILFVGSSFSYFPFVHVISNINDMPLVIQKMLKTKVEAIYLNDYINKLENVSFEINLDMLKSSINSWFYFNGTIPDTNIDENKMKSFLKKFESEFSLLANEYAKKLSN